MRTRMKNPRHISPPLYSQPQNLTTDDPPLKPGALVIRTSKNGLAEINQFCQSIPMVKIFDFALTSLDDFLTLSDDDILEYLILIVDYSSHDQIDERTVQKLENWILRKKSKDCNPMLVCRKSHSLDESPSQWHFDIEKVFQTHNAEFLWTTSHENPETQIGYAICT